MEEIQVIMSLKELDQIKIFEKLKEKSITGSQAASALRLSLRQVRRKIKKFVSLGAGSLAHQKRGKPSNRRIYTALETKIVDLIKERYSDFGPTFASEMLCENHSIVINKETLRLIMKRNSLWIPKARKPKSRRWRPRKSCLGELIQLDGSNHDWFEGRRARCTLLVFIDDATSEIVWLEFSESESLDGVMKASKNYFIKYGRPLRFYTDYGSVFAVNLNNTDNIKKTQYERALKELGIGNSHARSAQAKGRVERSNKTHQDRLVKMLRLENISNIESANAYLQNVYMPKHNSKFAVKAAAPQDLHRSIKGYDLDNILCFKDERVLLNDYTISYKTKFLQLDTEQKTILRPRDKIIVHERLDGTIRLFIRNTELYFLELPERPQKQAVEKTIKNHTPKPASNHPWRNLGILKNGEYPSASNASI